MLVACIGTDETNNDNDFVNANNIDRFLNCSNVKGSLRILQSTFDGSVCVSVMPMISTKF